MSNTTTKKKGGIGETIRTITWAVLIALVIRTFAFEPFSIPSGSMIPSLLVGDYLFVSKYSYGYSQYSFPFSPPLFDGRVIADQPERGDVAVFKLPSDNSTDYIKRVIGLPGDRIQVRNGILSINGEAVEREKLREVRVGNASVTIYRETLPNGVTHLIRERSDSEWYDNTPVFRVPEGHYFMMGDNRDSSQDSRTKQVGYVPFENFVGRAEFLFFSHDGSAAIWEIWGWPSAIRFGRILDAVN